MQIIFGREAATAAAERYTVLPLETFQVTMPDGVTGLLEAFSVLGAEELGMDLLSIESSKKVHQQLVEAIEQENAEQALNLARELKGTFGGHMDTFYDDVVDRVVTTGTTLPRLPTEPVE